MNYYLELVTRSVSKLTRPSLSAITSIISLCTATAMFAQTPSQLVLPKSANVTESLSVNSYVSVLINSVSPSGTYSFSVGSTYAGWCFDAFGDVPNDSPTANFDVYNSYGTLPAGLTNTTNPNAWNEVNWLLNNKTGYNGDEASANSGAGPSVSEIQEAIWTIIDQYVPNGIYTGSDPVVNTLVNDAVTHGANFVPGPGQIVAILFAYDNGSGPQPIQSSGDGNPGPQDFFMELPLPTPQTPNISIVKSANVKSANAGQPVTYSYVVTNTGTVTLTNITVLDDNGTPNYTADDFYATCPSTTLAPAASMTCTATVIPKVNVSVETASGGSIDDNLLLISEPTTGPYAGDLVVSYIQSLQINDNTYGSNSSPTWANAGTQNQFSNLLSGNAAEFQFTDTNGNVVLDFLCDYLSAASSATFGNGKVSYPSGYGSLGANGGDGKMITGNSSYILYATSTLTTNLNQSSEFWQYTKNSPARGTNDYNQWNRCTGYTVVISPKAFGGSLSKCGGVKVPNCYNSHPITKCGPQPPKQICNTSVTNTAVATATASANGTTVTVNDSSQATVGVVSTSSSCPSTGCTTTASNPSKFFSSCLSSGQTLWLTSVIELTGSVPSSGVTITVSNGTILLPDGTSVAVPNGTITFSPTAKSTSTVFTNNMWETTVPLNAQGDVFATAVAYTPTQNICPKDSDLITWNATFSSSVPGVTVDWQWSASAYNNYGVQGSQCYSWACVKSVDGNGDSNYKNNDCAGTPEFFKWDVCAGGTGLGGNNYCGLRGGSIDVTICPPSTPPPPPPHCHAPSPAPHCPPPTPTCK